MVEEFRKTTRTFPPDAEPDIAGKSYQMRLEESGVEKAVLDTLVNVLVCLNKFIRFHEFLSVFAQTENVQTLLQLCPEHLSTINKQDFPGVHS